MEWRNVHLRFSDMKDGDVSLCRISHDLWCPTSQTVCFYLEGELYDQNALDGLHPEDMKANRITDIIDEYVLTGSSVINQLPYIDKGE